MRKLTTPMVRILSGTLGTALVVGGLVAMPGSTGLGQLVTGSANQPDAAVASASPAPTKTRAKSPSVAQVTPRKLLVHPGDPRLAVAIVRAIGRSGLGSSVGIAVRHLDGTVVLRRRASRPLVPASNEKLVTLSAVLSELGPGRVLETRVLVGAPIRGGVLRGNLYLVGGGDPTFSTRAYAHARYAVPVATIENLAVAVRRAGIRRITGHVVGDGSLWDAKRGGSGWKPSFLPEQSTPLSALTVNRSTAGAKVVWRPEAHAAALLTAALHKTKIKVPGKATTGTRPAVAHTTLASVSSPSLATIAALTGKDSDNFLAESLLKDLAAYSGSTPHGPATTAAGAALALRFLHSAGVPTANVRIADGSGLSLGDRETADTLSQLLLVMRTRPAGTFLRAALPVSGVDGTLRSRLKFVRGLVRAKTGTLNESSALSGYAGDYAFSVLVNGSLVNQYAAHALQDRIATILATAG